MRGSFESFKSAVNLAFEGRSLPGGHESETRPVEEKPSASDQLMVIKGKRMTGQLTLEVNGVVVAPPLVVKAKGAGTKARISGSAQSLNLSAGPNRIRLRDSALLRSNVYLLNL